MLFELFLFPLSVVLLSHVPRHNLWRAGNTLKLTSLGLCMILCSSFFHLICLDFFLFFSFVSGMAPFCWMSKLWGCCCYATVCWWIKPEALQNQMCLGVIVLFQTGGLLIRSGERSHSSLWSNRLWRSVWLCCSSSGQFENTFEKPLWILIRKVVFYQLIYCSNFLPVLHFLVTISPWVGCLAICIIGDH